MVKLHDRFLSCSRRCGIILTKGGPKPAAEAGTAVYGKAVILWKVPTSIPENWSVGPPHFSCRTPVLHHIRSGQGTCIINSRKYLLHAGDSFLVYPDTTIHYYADAADPWEYVWVGFNGMDAERYVAMTDFSRESPVLAGEEGAAIAGLLEEIYRAYGTSTWENLAMTGKLYALLSHLVEQAQRGKTPRRDALDCAEAAADYIVNHFAEPLTVEQLADHFSVSHSSLYRKFIKRYQMSPKRFLLEYRIDRACILLSTTDHSVQEVSNSVGFDDPFYFSRVFKEIRGVSPRRYAAAHQQQREADPAASMEQTCSKI